MSENEKIYYKGFNKYLQCRGYQFEIGNTYTQEGEIKACENGFHSCENPLDVFGYHPPGESRFCAVTIGGDTSTHETDSKISSAEITIKAELALPDFIASVIEYMTALCLKTEGKHAKGYSSASSATGYRSASSATGYRSASSATGHRSASSVNGKNAVAMNIGIFGKCMASEGGAIVLCNHDDEGNIRHIRASKVGENGIKQDTWYRLDDSGEFVEA